MITATEALILGLLARKVRGAYGSELVHSSGGRLKRSSVYALLGRLEKEGLVESSEQEPSEEYAIPRTVYKITAAGVKAYADFAVFVGLEVPAGSAA